MEEMSIKEGGSMNIRSKQYIFREGDVVEIHLNESGSDYFFTGILRAFDELGTTVENDSSFVFIPHYRIVYLQKHKVPPEGKK
jgi:hypothetical protein